MQTQQEQRTLYDYFNRTCTVQADNTARYFQEKKIRSVLSLKT